MVLTSMAIVKQPNQESSAPGNGVRKGLNFILFQHLHCEGKLIVPFRDHNSVEGQTRTSLDSSFLYYNLGLYRHTNYRQHIYILEKLPIQGILLQQPKDSVTAFPMCQV